MKHCLTDIKHFDQEFKFKTKSINCVKLNNLKNNTQNNKNFKHLTKKKLIQLNQNLELIKNQAQTVNNLNLKE